MKTGNLVASGFFLLGATLCDAATLSVTVQDPQGRAVPGVGVVAVPAVPVPATEPQTAVMDQVQLKFEPNLLVVRKGTVVSFPNSDDVAHQVYSFSPAKRFELPLYRGQAAQPVTFEQSGLVILGCNIHDSMIGYVYVADSPYFGKTDAQGQIQFNGLADGSYRVLAWSPRFTEANPELAQQVTVTGAANASFRLARPLLPAPQDSPAKKLRY